MADVNKINSNVVGFSFAEESSLGTLTTPTFWGLEPNSFNDFGANLTLLARTPITTGRQRKKGVITDLDAGGGFNTDLTQDNLQLLLQGFFFADLRKHAEDPVASITATNQFNGTALGATRYPNGTLLKTTGFTNAVNNSTSYFIVTGVSSTTGVICSGATLTNETAPAAAKMVAVGWKSAISDMAVVAEGPDGLPTITSTSGAFVDLGLKAGEWIYIGGDSSDLKFAVAANNGWKRIRKVVTGTLTIDKSDAAMANESASGSLTPTIFFGRMLKNETGSLIKRRSYQLERLLGAPNDSSPSEIQSEYLVGAVPNKFEMNIAPATKITCDLSFVAKDFETRTGATGKKVATVDNRNYNTGADAFNTSSDFSRIKLSTIPTGSEAPTPLFAFVTDLKVSIDNGVTPDKAVGVLGAFDMSEGDFVVSGSLTAYFASVDAVAAVRNNSDVTLDFAIAKENAGIVVDIPLIALGDGRVNVEKDKAITIPLTLQAATGASIHANLDHTMSMCFFDYLPNVAEA